ncbi:MAG: bifunctional diaminohydroxyphosphoribosylaminopyrimidine deaminase/5-amino-6-(5-phosphoribosylamino)uracil reductase RibD [Phycisphaeraceae bacterium]|nr:MAG: bifunctional diaminohydroxyphosphoribosylaminopyrimidine deaminase/5-amino-6-(5-phosphoribosylamino)uracil reductase RibD [Phycisphaeraceae bacterium]
MLDRAARLALRGAGLVEPNPMVGAVIVRGGEVIGAGHHRFFGGPHAEAEALDDCRRRGHDPAGATMYVTLEPCDHHGKQPPCTGSIIASGISRVVFARRDPNPAASGGAARLFNAGLAVELCGESPLARGVGAPFTRRITAGLPWVIAKWAQTIDGRVATRTGESKWVSGERSRARVHRLRARVDAVITGIGTVLADDPMLTARGVRRVRRPAARVICDSDLDLPLDAAVVRTAREVPTIVACVRELASADLTASKRRALSAAGVEVIGVPEAGRGVDLRAVLGALAGRGASVVMVEAGPGLVGSFLDSDLIDEAVVYLAPLMLGDEMARSVAAGRVAPTLASARAMSLWRVKPLGGDVELTYRRPDPPDVPLGLV